MYVDSVGGFEWVVFGFGDRLKNEPPPGWAAGGGVTVQALRISSAERAWKRKVMGGSVETQTIWGSLRLGTLKIMASGPSL